MPGHLPCQTAFKKTSPRKRRTRKTMGSHALQNKNIRCRLEPRHSKIYSILFPHLHARRSRSVMCNTSNRIRPLRCLSAYLSLSFILEFEFQLCSRLPYITNISSTWSTTRNYTVVRRCNDFSLCDDVYDAIRPLAADVCKRVSKDLCLKGLPRSTHPVVVSFSNFSSFFGLDTRNRWTPETDGRQPAILLLMSVWLAFLLCGHASQYDSAL
ncbi:hypothetical protein BJ878DRAFT_73271 [Calycina marina]|uniref:Uncharacterized protein n=1 Tax=Calycina marina TaxID=1763456 RepID=A0A9P8CF23_9HELO|nr:hypothetical protein BJ878DRAFT_73271 [Calycina marina]